MLGTMTVLADSGIASGVMTQAGRDWRDRSHLGVVIATGLELRRQFAWATAALAMPILLYLLTRHGAQWDQAVILACTLIPLLTVAMSGTILEVAPKLHQCVTALQKISIFTHFGRFLILLCALPLLPVAAVAILATAGCQLVANFHLRKLTANLADKNQSPSSATRIELLSRVRKVLPTSIYYCLSAQISIWLLSIFGTTTAIAHIGALTRFNQALYIITTILNTLVVPRFARIPSGSPILKTRFTQSTTGVFIAAIAAIILVHSCSSTLLRVLGPAYASLSTELTLAFSGGALVMVSAHVNALANSRGWIMNPAHLIGAGIASKALLVYMIDVSTLQGVLLIGIIDPIIFILLRYWHVALTLPRQTT